MAEGLKKEELDLTSDHDELVVELDEETNEDIQEVDNDPLNVDISLEDVKDLTIEECDILAVKLEVAIDKCEEKMDQILDVGGVSEEDSADYEEIKAEHKRLKSLEKAIISQKKSIQKGTKEGGLFGNLPVWSFILFIICALFTIVPINPYFPVEIYISYADKLQDTFLGSMKGAYVFYFTYIGFFIIIEIIIFIILLIRGLKSKERMGTFKSYLVMFIVNILIDVPGVIIFLNAALKS